MLAREKKTQKIDPIHLCFGDSGRLFTNTENRPDQSTSRLVRDTSDTEYPKIPQIFLKTS